MQSILQCKFYLQPNAAAAAKLLQSSPTMYDPIDGSPPVSQSLGFLRQEYWSGLPLPSSYNQIIAFKTYNYKMINKVYYFNYNLFDIIFQYYKTDTPLLWQKVKRN